MKLNTLNSKIPKIFHNYELESEICEIPCGKLFIGLNKYINQKVYIKIYDKLKLFINFKEVSFINNEIFVLKLLNQKNILQLYEYIESDNFIFVIFEYFKGQTLQNFFLKKKKLNENLSLNIFYEIIIAMNYIHSMNLCHLNLNFQNILIDDNNNIKLINFQNSCFYKGNIKKDLKKNDIFSCPEIYAKDFFSPEKADVYACGVILYYFLMGYFPFYSDKKIINEELIMKGKYTIPITISKNIKILISKMLEYNSSKRIEFKDIINSECFKENKNAINKLAISQGINILKNKYPIEQNVLNICKIYNINISKISEDIQNNSFTSNISLYKQLVKFFILKKIPTVYDYISEKYNYYISNKANIYTEEKQKENIEKYIKDEKKKNEKMAKIEENFFYNGSEVLKELKNIKLKLEEKKNIIKSNNHDNLLKTEENTNLFIKDEKSSSLKKYKRNKRKNNTKKVTIKIADNGPIINFQNSNYIAHVIAINCCTNN